MPDGPAEVTCNPAQAALTRIVDEFAWLSDQALEHIIRGGVSGFIRPSLAAAIIDARRVDAVRGAAGMAVAR